MHGNKVVFWTDFGKKLAADNLGIPLTQIAENQKEIIKLLSSINKTLKEKGLEGLSAGQDFTERKK